MQNSYSQLSNSGSSLSSGGFSGQKGAGILKVISMLLVALYLVNCGTPLRLHVDMLRYFAIKDCIEFGCPPDSDAARDYLPFGYTALLLVLSKIGILKSWSIVLINCVYLFAGVWLVARIFTSVLNPLLLLILVLLNWTTIKFTTHPLSEMQYLFFSVSSVYLFYRYTQNKNIWLLLSAFAMGGLAFLTRSVGISLAAALITGLLWQYRKELLGLIRKNRILVGGIILIFIGVVVFSKQLGLNHYTGVFNKQFKEGVTLPVMLGWHFTEWAEIGFNVSLVKVQGYFPMGSGPLFFRLAGILIFAGFVYLLFIRKNKIPFIVKSYLFFYSALMFNWPFYDPRFWVPVFPFVVAVLVQSSISRGKVIKGLGTFYLTVYSLLGVLSIGYMTYTSLNRKVMSRTHANGVYRNEYETFFYGKPLSDTALRIDPAVLSVIQRYDK